MAATTRPSARRRSRSDRRAALNEATLRRLRLRAHLLSPRAAKASAADVVRHCVLVQAQDAREARLGVRARSKDLTAASVERERVEDRSFVRAWSFRGTIHLTASEDYPWLRDLVALALSSQAHRRMAQEGMTPQHSERARKLLVRMLEDGPLTRAEIREELLRKGIRWTGRQATVHLLFWSTMEGEIVTGPYRGTKETMVLVRDWIGRPPRPPKDPVTELARRYLGAHGPATPEDFLMWSKLRVGPVRAAWAALGSELVERDGLWSLRSQATRAPAASSVRLLPAWDHYHLAYRDRSHLAPPADIPTGALYAPLVVVDGRAVANWRLGKDGVQVTPFPGAAAPPRAGLDREIADVVRFQSA